MLAAPRPCTARSKIFSTIQRVSGSITVHFSEYGRRPYAPCGAIGEDTDEVLGGLGYSEADIAQMRESGAAK